MKRRNFLTGGAAASAGLTVAALSGDVKADSHGGAKTDGPITGKLKQSVCQWCYEGMSVEELCVGAKEIGIKSVEIIGPDLWDTVIEHGLTCAMSNGPSGISDGWNVLANHDEMVEKSEELLPEIARRGFPNMILFSGNKRDLGDVVHGVVEQ
jgi:hydroxypyruvate isomerase